MQSYQMAQGVTDNTISLMLGHPDPTTLLTPELQTAINRVLASPKPYQSLQYGAEQGTPGLIDYLVAKINREQASSINSDQLILVAGSTQAVDMIARLFTEPGDAVIVEAPSYVDALHVFYDHGVELYSSPMDENGLIPEDLEKLLKRLQAGGKPPRLLYTIPNFHNPTGFSLCLERRNEIAQLAERYKFMIVEDDVYRDLIFEGTTPPSFLTLSGETMSIGSFSKTLAPGLRLGWLAGPSEIIERILHCGTIEMGGGANPFTAQIVAEYCYLQYWEQHIHYLQQLYCGRRDIMMAALDQYMPRNITWTRPSGGFFVWVTLPENIQARDVKQQAFERGVLVSSGEGFFVNPTQGEHNLRLTYSFAQPEEIKVGVRILGEIVRKLANFAR
jgi:2-aminoadipate transaminase